MLDSPWFLVWVVRLAGWVYGLGFWGLFGLLVLLFVVCCLLVWFCCLFGACRFVGCWWFCDFGVVACWLLCISLWVLVFWIGILIWILGFVSVLVCVL